MNTKIICTACGTQYSETSARKDGCPICNDDRQAVPESGQTWTNLHELQNSHSMIIREVRTRLHELKMAPSFAIGQRALFVESPGGNILWDCVALINDPTIAWFKSKGGINAIAFSHPHYYTTMNEWAAIFECPIYIHQQDAEWIFNKGTNVKLWEGKELALWDDIRLINVGGHFPGSSILLDPTMGKDGTMLCGDTFYLSPSKKHFSIAYSYPNRIPLPISTVNDINTQMQGLAFDSIYGFYDFQNVDAGAKELLLKSLEHYV